MDYIKEFYDRLLNGKDPFTLFRKAKEKESEQKKDTKKAEPIEQEKKYLPPQKASVVYTTQQKRSFLHKIVSKIKNLFNRY